MSEDELSDLLGHIRQAASEARTFVAGMTREAFLADAKTQRAVVMSIIIVGEAATKIMARHPQFVIDHPELRWHQMRGMRNRIAHGYFQINFDVVWDTVQTALPELLEKLPSVDRPDGEGGP